jgi:hypothetical protein
MTAKIKLEVIKGPMQGKTYPFEEHDAFLFGRMADCHACLPNDDQVSRHHFILEVNPPDACLRDLGSLNGTHVNKMKYGGRAKDETPEQGAQRRHPEVALKDGDEIKVGQTVLVVRVEVPAVCCECDAAILDKDRDKCSWVGGTFICLTCKAKLEAQAVRPKAPEPVRCKKCGKDVSKEIGRGRRGDYLCEACQKQAEADPLLLLEQMLRQAGAMPPADKSMKIPGYEVEKKLQVGGFGAVYLARRKKDGAEVAIKVMLSKIAVDEKSRKAFLREIENLKALKHDHIVPLLESGSAGTGFYFVMEFCDGGSVGDLMRANGGKLALSEAGPIMLHALKGLAFAHKQGYVHRDLKPDNLLLLGAGSRRIAKVSDFGLAKNFQNAGFSGHTVTGSYAGTPSFMPREQVVNYRHMKPVSDVWSMGATLYNMLTSHIPRDFPRGRDPVQIILQESVVPVRQRDANVPRKVAEVIDRCLTNDIKERYQDAEQMRAALAKAL